MQLRIKFKATMRSLSSPDYTDDIVWKKTYSNTISLSFLLACDMCVYPVVISMNPLMQSLALLFNYEYFPQNYRMPRILTDKCLKLLIQLKERLLLQQFLFKCFSCIDLVHWLYVQRCPTISILLMRMYFNCQSKFESFSYFLLILSKSNCKKLRNEIF